MGRITRGALVGFLFALTVGVWPADATISSVKVTSPTQSQVLEGKYSSDGSPSGFNVNLRGSATTDCNGFSAIKFTVTGPSYSNSWNLTANSAKNWSGGPASPWNTEDRKNGIYTVRIDVTETGGLLCEDQSKSAYVTAKLANAAKAPLWDGSPTAAPDGSPSVTLQWKKNGESDVVEYLIIRNGPDGEKEASVSASNPGAQGCSLSSNTFSCTDTSFPSSYNGSYSYTLKALRSRPDYNSSEDPKDECKTTNKPCVHSSASDVRQVTLTAPTPTPSPSPSDSPTGSPSPGPKPTLSVGGPSSGSRSSRGPSVLSFGSSNSGGSGFNDFYSGTYEERLPYQPKSLIVGNGTSTPDGQVEAAALSSEPPNYRTIMLPVAGGLLAFLSAAHVRRLLVHF